MFRQIVYCTAIFLLFDMTDLFAAEPAASESKSIVAVDEEYVKAFNAGDVEAAVRTFTKDAVYITDDGKTLRGVDEIKKVLSEQFKELQGAKLKLNVYAIEFSPDKQKATERGVSIVTTSDGIDEPSSYIAEFTRQGNQWQISRVVETPQAITAEHLEPLAWMIGDWTDQSEDIDISTKVGWSLNRGFITRKFTASGVGRDLTGVEYIGWDPSKNQIHSWYFDSDGGHGTGVWRHEGKSWFEDITAVTPRGEVATATHIFTPKGQNSFAWRAIHRLVGGQPQNDIPEVVIHRTTSEQLQAAREQL